MPQCLIFASSFEYFRKLVLSNTIPDLLLDRQVIDVKVKSGKFDTSMGSVLTGLCKMRLARHGRDGGTIHLLYSSLKMADWEDEGCVIPRQNIHGFLDDGHSAYSATNHSCARKVLGSEKGTETIRVCRGSIYGSNTAKRGLDQPAPENDRSGSSADGGTSGDRARCVWSRLDSMSGQAK